jgi:hypothetical protein
MIHNDADSDNSPLKMDGYFSITNANQVHMVINSGGYFNSSSFSGTGSDRGTIFLIVKD